eukprot:jgi/Ulvmu1/11494/UM077_0043.1
MSCPSRTQSNLETAAAEIAEQFGVKKKSLTIGLVEVASMPLESEAWAGLQESVDAMDVGVLVNNAGKTQGGPNEFHLVDSTGADSTVMLNTMAMLKVTNLVLPRHGRAWPWGHRKRLICSIQVFSSSSGVSIRRYKRLCEHIHQGGS